MENNQVHEGVDRKFGMYVYILPNLVTTCNIFCGFFAIIYSMKQNYLYAAYAIVVAALFDQLDGRLARLTRSTSKFGAEYDSLCDVVSFGVAPAVLMFQWALQPFGRLGWMACFLFVACGAIRLARFNVQVNIVEKSYFQGLPIPMAGGIVASSVLAFSELKWNPWGNELLLGITILLALVMVSSFRYRSFKDLDLKQRLPFRYLIFGVCIFVLVAYRPEVNLFFLFLTYAVLGAVFGVLNFGKNKKIRPSVYMPAHVHEQDLIPDEDGDPVITEEDSDFKVEEKK